MWIDWVLLPIMLGGGWLTLRWGLADMRQADKLGTDSLILPAWTVAVPLIICALSWVLLGFGSLIKEPYYEHRVYRLVFIIWSLSCLIGAAVILLSLLRNSDFMGLASMLNLIGLLLMALMIIIPAFMQVPSGSQANLFSHIWTILLIVAAVCLTGGMLLGFPYNFPRFPLGIAALFLLGLGALEIAFPKPAFAWLPHLWKTQLGNKEFLATLPDASFWRFHGIFMLLLGIMVVLLLLNSSFHFVFIPTRANR